jgi:hypothetical protein
MRTLGNQRSNTNGMKLRSGMRKFADSLHLNECAGFVLQNHRGAARVFGIRR